MEIILQVVVEKSHQTCFVLRPDRAVLIMTSGMGQDENKDDKKIKLKRYSGLANGRLQCSYNGSLPCCPASILQGLFQNASSCWWSWTATGRSQAARMTGHGEDFLTVWSWSRYCNSLMCNTGFTEGTRRPASSPIQLQTTSPTPSRKTPYDNLKNTQNGVYYNYYYDL